ncbi:hypothetical protein D3C73_1239760 [compost metagenome]
MRNGLNRLLDIRSVLLPEGQADLALVLNNPQPMQYGRADDVTRNIHQQPLFIIPGDNLRKLSDDRTDRLTVNLCKLCV